MKRIRVYQIDAFTRERFHGNPAGVVPNADGLSEAVMRRIARELNNSETAFLLAPRAPGYDVEARFFTPTTEVPVCGHATVAAHYVRALEGAPAGVSLQKTKAGVLPVEIAREDGDWAITMTQGAPEVGEPLPAPVARRIARALGVDEADLRADCPVAIASTGHSKVMVGIRARDTLDCLRPDLAALSALSAEIGCNGYYAFTLSPGAEPLVHGRMFAPAIGIAEDPVTGNANGPLGAYLVRYAVCRELQGASSFAFSIRQGEAIRRDGGMRVQVRISDGKPVQVRITGRAVVAFRTEIDVDADRADG